MTARLDHQALAPRGLQALVTVRRYLREEGLAKTLLDLVNLRASQINGCAYCTALHAKSLLASGISPTKPLLAAAWRDAGPTFTREEAAALRWTESLTLVAQTQAPDDDFEAVSAVFRPKQVVDLTIAIGLINAYNRLSIASRQPPGVEAIQEARTSPGRRRRPSAGSAR